MIIVCLEDDCVVLVEMLEANPGGWRCWRCHSVQLQTSSPVHPQSRMNKPISLLMLTVLSVLSVAARWETAAWQWNDILMFWLFPVRAARRMLTVSPGQICAVLMFPRWIAGGRPAAPPRTLSSSLPTSTIWPRHSDTNWTPPSPPCPRCSWTWWCARACSTPWWRDWAAVLCSWRPPPGYNNSHRLTSPLASPPPSLSSQSFVSQRWQDTWLQYNRRDSQSVHCNSTEVISRASESKLLNNPNSTDKVKSSLNIFIYNSGF